MATVEQQRFRVGITDKQTFALIEKTTKQSQRNSKSIEFCYGKQKPM